MEALGIQTVSLTLLDEMETQIGDEGSIKKESKPETYEPKPIDFLKEKPKSKPKTVELDDYDRKDRIVEEDSLSPKLPSRASHGKLFTDKRAHPLQLFDTLNMRYKEAWAAWEPETLQWAIRRDFSSIGELTLNKIQALGVAGRADTTWLDWDIFENSGLAWNDIIPIFGAFQAMTPMQIAFAVHVLNSIRREPFSHEVNAYIAAVLDDHGFAYAPEEWFAGAQDILERTTKVIGIRGEVEEAWEKIKNFPPQEIDWDYNNALDVHLMKMTVIKKYLEERKLLRTKVPGVAMATVTIGTTVT